MVCRTIQGAGGGINVVDSLGCSECTGKEEEPAAEGLSVSLYPSEDSRYLWAWCLGSPRPQSLSPEVLVKHEAGAFSILPNAFRDRRYFYSPIRLQEAGNMH